MTSKSRIMVSSKLLLYGFVDICLPDKEEMNFDVDDSEDDDLMDPDGMHDVSFLQCILNLTHWIQYKIDTEGLDGSKAIRPRAQRRASQGGKWTAEEDQQLKDIVTQHGAKGWKKVCACLS